MTYFRHKTTVFALLFAVTAATSCLEEPDIDERWTLVEMLAVSPGPGATTTGGQTVDITVKGRITYRNILTGFLVAEVRSSDTVSPQSTALNVDRHTLDDAQNVDRILANSVTAGRATRAVTGWDHLMQDVELSFTAQLPATVDPNGGVYLLLYMGEGDEMRLQDGRDSLVVTPFVSTEREVLHTGFALNLTPGGGP